jgi:signal transduction histidine kinase
VRYYRHAARVDLGALFLAADIAIFVGAIYVSGGERSWLLPLLCVRVADQVATSPRRAFLFATETVLLHAALVLYLAFVEERGLSLAAELTKVGLVYLLNIYLALAAGPGERQRLRAKRLAEVARDLIAQLRLRTDQLEVQRARAEAASQAKSAFMSNMSHEIRTPMTAVLGNAELLLTEPLEPRERAMAQTILTSGKSLLALVNDVLDIAKVEAGRLEMQLTDVDLCQLLRACSAR